MANGRIVNMPAPDVGAVPGRDAAHDRLPGPENRRPAAADSGRVSYAIFMLARAHRGHAARLLRELGLHPGQEHLLMRLYDRDGQTQSELLDAVGLDHSTVSKALARMEQAGFVRRQRSTEDRRVVVIWLTDEGRALRAPIEAMWAALEKVTVEALQDYETEAFLVMIDNVQRAIERLA